MKKETEKEMMVQRIIEGKNKVVDTIKRNPKKSIAIGILAGIGLGWLWHKRKKRQ